MLYIYYYSIINNINRPYLVHYIDWITVNHNYYYDYYYYKTIQIYLNININ